MKNFFWKCVAFLAVMISSLMVRAQDGAGQFLGAPVSVREIGLPKEIPARMDFHVVVNAPYSVQIQGRLRDDEPGSK
ncbi:MAG: hypothetical protein ACKO18_00870, partial [Bacteroidota bacterium]